VRARHAVTARSPLSARRVFHSVRAVRTSASSLTGLLLLLAGLGTGCATWDGQVGRFAVREGALVSAPYPHTLYVAPPEVDPASHPDAVRVAASFAASYQERLTEDCSSSGLFAACTLDPVPGAFVLNTRALIQDASPPDLGVFLLSMAAPPVIGMFWGLIFLVGDFEGTTTFTLTSPDGEVVASRPWTADAIGPPDVVLVSQDGFPAFLERARSSLAVRFGPAAAAPAIAAPRPAPRASSVVAVFDVEDGSRALEPGTLDQLTEYLAAQLVEAAGFRVVPRNQLRARLAAEKAGSYDACFDESCQIELGKALAAEKSLATKLLKVGRSCALAATLYDLRSETTEAASTVESDCSADALMVGVKRLAAKLAER
jgi:hypothetical protein